VPVDDAALKVACFAAANDGAANAVPARNTAPAATAVSFSVFFSMGVSFRWIADPEMNLGKPKTRKGEIQDAVRVLPANCQGGRSAARSYRDAVAEPTTGSEQLALPTNRALSECPDKLRQGNRKRTNWAF
jgi:hypothetical protein